MKKYRIRFCLFYLIIIVLILYVNCEIDKNAYKNEEFVFPEIDYIDSNVYDEIKITCETYWNLSDMIDSTFKIIEYEDRPYPLSWTIFMREKLSFIVHGREISQ